MRIQNFEPAQWFEQLATKKYDLTSTYWSATLDPAHLYFPIGLLEVARGTSPATRARRSTTCSRSSCSRATRTARKAAYPEVVRRSRRGGADPLPHERDPALLDQADNIQGAAPLPSLEIRAEEMWRES